MERDAQALELFERPQDVPTSHDFLSQDAYILYAQFKKVSLGKINKIQVKYLRAAA